MPAQAELFERLGRDLVQHVLEGYNATVPRVRSNGVEGGDEASAAQAHVCG